MNRLQKSVLLVFISAVLLNACTSSKSLYEQGNYYESVMRSVEKLRKNPNNKNSREALAVAYPSAVNYFMDQLENNETGNTDFRYTKEVAIYGKLNQMYEHIQRSPGAMQVIDNPRKYYAALDQIKPFAAEEQYAAGMTLLNMGNRESAKEAFGHFLRAEEFVPGYKDAGAMADEAYHNAILHVVANFRPIQSKFYQLNGEEFYRQVGNTLNHIEQNEFIRFYTPEEAEKNQLQFPDQVIEINFEDFVIGETHTKETIEKMVRDSVVVGEVELDRGGTKEVYGSVKADVHVNRMEVASRGIVSLTVSRSGPDNKDLLYQDFPGQFVWFHEWGHFNGDERALTTEQVEICHRKRVNPIPPQQMFAEFTRPIQQQLNNRLISFYRNY